MDGLMQIEDDEGSQYLSDQEVLDNIVGLVVAGYESTSVASTWAIYYLAKYPHVLAKLRVWFVQEEIARFSQTKLRFSSFDIFFFIGGEHCSMQEQ